MPFRSLFNMYCVFNLMSFFAKWELNHNVSCFYDWGSNFFTWHTRNICVGHHCDIFLDMFQRYEIVNGITEVEDVKVEEAAATETNGSGKINEKNILCWEMTENPWLATIFKYLNFIQRNLKFTSIISNELTLSTIKSSERSSWVLAKCDED